MNIHEYQGKEIFRSMGVAMLQSQIATSSQAGMALPHRGEAVNVGPMFVVGPIHPDSTSPSASIRRLIAPINSGPAIRENGTRR